MGSGGGVKLSKGDAMKKWRAIWLARRFDNIVHRDKSGEAQRFVKAQQVVVGPRFARSQQLAEDQPHPTGDDTSRRDARWHKHEDHENSESTEDSRVTDAPWHNETGDGDRSRHRLKVEATGRQWNFLWPAWRTGKCRQEGYCNPQELCGAE
jgi:hypothetical protein